ncbi:MAG: tetratricopeptide repeat protein [Alphaproteobacteria bacterium]|nr:tetratricopeptide repeat protein [Alphaproteobacteria bacterium]
MVLNVLREHRMLLVWDNFESVRSMPAETTPPLDEAGQAAIRDFVAALTAPGGKSGLIVTSRAAEEWLGAVDHLPLGGLDREAANEYVDHLLALSAAGRERRKDKAFGDLLQFLAGHPLSLRLIIPQLTHRNPAALLAELSPPPLAGEGQGGGRRAREFDSTQRLQNLDACVHYSFRHLPEAVRRLLPALTLFEGVADAVVLMLVSNVAEVPDRYRGITREQWTAALDQAAGLGLLTSLWGGQYRIHPALPKYLDGLWRDEAGADYAGERTAAEDAFVTAVADFGRWLDRQIQGGSAETAMSLIDLQRRTLGRAIDEALAAERWPQAQDILQPLNEFWNARGLTEEAQAWTSRIHKQIESPQGTPPDFDTPVGALWLFITGAQANRALSAGDLATAYTAYDGIREALETTSSDKARSHLAVACHQLGIVAQKRGDLDDAERWYRKSLEMWQALGDRPGMATTYHQLGMVAQERGDLDDAERWYRKALGIDEALGERPGMAQSYHQLGMVAQERGDLDDAERWYRKAVEIDEALGDRPGMAQSYHQLGNVGYLRGDLDDAERWYRKSLEIGEALANGPVMALTYGQLGLLAETRGSKAEALAWMVRCVALFDQFPHPVTRSAPQHLARLAGELGMAALEEAWKAATGGPLPDAVRTWVSTPPATS